MEKLTNLLLKLLMAIMLFAGGLNLILFVVYSFKSESEKGGSILEYLMAGLIFSAIGYFLSKVKIKYPEKQ